MGGQGSGQQVDIVTMIELETGGREVKRKGEPPCYPLFPRDWQLLFQVDPPFRRRTTRIKWTHPNTVWASCRAIARSNE